MYVNESLSAASPVAQFSYFHMRTGLRIPIVQMLGLVSNNIIIISINIEVTKLLEYQASCPCILTKGLSYKLLDYQEIQGILTSIYWQCSDMSLQTYLS